jgi:hypothetical protein
MEHLRCELLCPEGHGAPACQAARPGSRRGGRSVRCSSRTHRHGGIDKPGLPVHVCAVSTLRFPSYFPPACPPAEARDANGAFYRIVSGSPLREDDFKSHREGGTAPSAPPCGRCGISVFISRAGACHRLRLSPHLGHAVAEGRLAPENGKTLLTNQRSGHVEWWPYDGVVRHQLFSDPRPCG